MITRSPHARIGLTPEERDNLNVTLNSIPGLPAILSELTGGNRRARERVTRVVFDALSQAQSSELTADLVLGAVGAPTDRELFGEWRQNFVSEQTPTPGRKESF